MAIVINGNWWGDYLNADPGNNVEFDPEYHIFGREGDDEIYGAGTSDYIDGGTDADRMYGGSGSDTYVVDNTGDRVIEFERDGWLINGGTNDQVNTTISFVLPELVEHLVLLEGGGAIDGFGNNLENDLTGNAFGNTLDGRDNNDEIFGLGGEDTLLGGRGDDKLYGGLHNDDLDGGEGDDTLDGQGGADTMRGGTGDDIYFVDNAGDEVVEFSQDAGIDTIHSSISFNLDGTAVENLTLQAGAVIGFGNSRDNTLTGNDASNELYGFFGEDTLKGGGGDDELHGGTQDDTLKGGGGDDELFGEGGDDRMEGHTGSDIYFVDSLGDEVVEDGPAEDIDTVNTTVSLTLSANVENLNLLSGAQNGTGNDLRNVIVGNSFNNTIDGGRGIDTMVGGTGDDTYLVDDLDDMVTELVGQGTLDTVKTSVSYRLALEAEVEQLAAADALSTASLDLVGNDYRNTIRGNDGQNMIDGGNNADLMIGRKGNDTYMVSDAGDRINELANEGTDQVFATVSVSLDANVENVTLTGVPTSPLNATGNTLGNVMVGNGGGNILKGLAGADTLRGNGGNDTLIGGKDADTVFGGAQSDVFVITALEDAPVGGKLIEYFADFSETDKDRIDLSAINVPTANNQFVPIGVNVAFGGNPGELRFNGGVLEGDVNGDGVADFQIRIDVAVILSTSIDL